MSRFTVTHLHEDRLSEALPLVRMAAPLVTPERWRKFARSLLCADGGVLAAFAGEGRAHGLAVYRLEESLVHGRTLRVEPMVTFELSPAAPARVALCQALELMAMAKGCDSLLISTGCRGYSGARPVKTGAWAALDFAPVSVEVAKRLPPPTSGRTAAAG